MVVATAVAAALEPRKSLWEDQMGRQMGIGLVLVVLRLVAPVVLRLVALVVLRLVA